MKLFDKELLNTDNKHLRNNYLQRKIALLSYYSNPNICKFCKSIIKVKEGHLTQEAKRQKFCSRSCAASFNNKKFVKRKIFVKKHDKKRTF